MIEVHIFNAGRTVQCWAFITDNDGVLVDPTSVAITINDSADAVKVASASMTKHEIGVYYYNYNIPAAGPTGHWLVTAVATDGVGIGAYTSDDTGSFEVQ
jgi:hypothetical protein